MSINKVMFDGNALIDLSTDTVASASDIAVGKVGHLNDGSVVTGTHQGGSYAFILLNFPSGATPDCYKGSEHLQPKTITSTQVLFNVPEGGTWTVHCYDSYHPDGVSTNVSITQSGQVEYVVLKFKLILYDHGDLCTAVSGGWIDQYSSWANYDNGKVNCALTNYASYLEVTATGFYRGFYFGTANMIDLTNISTLKIVIDYHEGDDTAGVFCVHSSSVSSNRSADNAAATVSLGTSSATKTLDVSGLTGNHYVGIRYRVGNNRTSIVRLSYLGEP